MVRLFPIHGPSCVFERAAVHGLRFGGLWLLLFWMHLVVIVCLGAAWVQPRLRTSSQLGALGVHLDEHLPAQLIASTVPRASQPPPPPTQLITYGLAFIRIMGDTKIKGHASDRMEQGRARSAGKLGNG